MKPEPPIQATGGAPAGWTLPPWTDGSAHYLAASRRTPR